MMVRNTIVSQKRDWPRALFTLAMTPPETRGLRLVGSQQLGAEARLVYHGRIDFQLADPRRPPEYAAQHECGARRSGADHLDG